ncbi:unnamed protein product, partial [Prorocentrum cordatum]
MQRHTRGPRRELLALPRVPGARPGRVGAGGTGPRHRVELRPQERLRRGGRRPQGGGGGGQEGALLPGRGLRALGAPGALVVRQAGGALQDAARRPGARAGAVGSPPGLEARGRGHGALGRGGLGTRAVDLRGGGAHPGARGPAGRRRTEAVPRAGSGGPAARGGGLPAARRPRPPPQGARHAGSGPSFVLPGGVGPVYDWPKMLLWGLTEFDAIVYLDLDTMPWRRGALEGLFAPVASAPFAPFAAVGFGPRSELNNGVFALRPSRSTLACLLAHARAGTFWRGPLANAFAARGGTWQAFLDLFWRRGAGLPLGNQTRLRAACAARLAEGPPAVLPRVFNFPASYSAAAAGAPRVGVVAEAWARDLRLGPLPSSTGSEACGSRGCTGRPWRARSSTAAGGGRTGRCAPVRGCGAGFAVCCR